MKYFVKTRNWNGNKYIAGLLALSSLAGVAVYGSDTDFDYKYCLDTSSGWLAWSVWLYFMALSPLSGGWTYLLRPGKAVDLNYKSIY